MQDIIKKRIIKFKTNILRARFNLMFMVILSAVNVLSVFAGNEAFMPFSVSISTFTSTLSVRIATEQNNDTFLYIGIIIAAIILGIVILCYLKSKNNPLYFVVALCVTVVDTLVLLIIAIGGLFYNTSFVVDLIVHIMTIAFLFSALKSQKELSYIENLASQAQNQSAEAHSDAQGSDINDEDDESDYSESDLEPIVSGQFEGLSVIVAITNNKAELIINNRVCDALDTSYVCEYELSAIVNDVDFYFQYKRSYSYETAYLYANDHLLDSYVTDFI